MSRTVSNARSVAASAITRAAFIRRFSAEERAAIALAGAHNPSGTTGEKEDAAEVRAIAELLFGDITQNVADSATIAAVNALQTLGVLAGGRPATILAAVAEADRP